MDIVVYTCITDDYDAPRDDVVVVEGSDKFKHPRMNAKFPKIMPHLFFETDWSIWVDGNLKLEVDPEELVAMAGDAEIAVFRNPYRGCLYDEAKECAAQRLDDPDVIEKQTQRYREDGFPEFKGLGACFLIIRKHTKRVASLNERWWAEICNGSMRDQISFPYVFDKHVKYLPSQAPFSNKYYTRKGHLKERT